MNFRTKAILHVLEKLSESHPDTPLNALEIGCMYREEEGLSTFIIADFIANKHPAGGCFVSIEFDPEHVEQCKQIIEKRDPTLLDKVDFRLGHSLMQMPQALSDLEIVHFYALDGGAHPEVCLDEFEQALKYLAPTGFVLVDDVQPIAPSEAYPYPRPFGKGTLIYPMLILAGYIHLRRTVRSANSFDKQSPTNADSGLINILESHDLDELTYDRFAVIGRGHQMLGYGTPELVADFKSLKHEPPSRPTPSPTPKPQIKIQPAPEKSKPLLDRILPNTPLIRRIRSRPLIDTLRDTYTTPDVCLQPSTSMQIWRTARYRAAAHGFAFTPNERRFLNLKNAHKGQRAFIMGNGPSLNKNDLTLLKDEVTFGVNSIFLNYEKMGYFPTYYVVEDVLVAEDRAPEINKYHGPKVRFFGNYVRYVIDDSPDTIWMNVKFDYRSYKNFPNFSRNALRFVWVGGTVSYICMQLAYYMGFSEVYLIGFDHSYNIPQDAQIKGNDITSTSDDPNHFHPDYFGKGYRWHDPRVDRMEMSYHRAKEHFEQDGRVIKNATVGGHLEVFERVDFNSLF